MHTELEKSFMSRRNNDGDLRASEFSHTLTLFPRWRTTASAFDVFHRYLLLFLFLVRLSFQRGKILFSYVWTNWRQPISSPTTFWQIFYPLIIRKEIETARHLLIHIPTQFSPVIRNLLPTKRFS